MSDEKSRTSRRSVLKKAGTSAIAAGGVVAASGTASACGQAQIVEDAIVYPDRSDGKCPDTSEMKGTVSCGTCADAQVDDCNDGTTLWLYMTWCDSSAPDGWVDGSYIESNGCADVCDVCSCSGC